MSQLPNTIELFEQSREYDWDAENASMSRRFLVPADRDTAATFPGVPSIGSTYTIGSVQLKLDRIRVEGTGDPGISQVIALYSANGLYKFPQRQDEESPTFKAENSTIQLRKITIPAFTRMLVKYEEGGQSLEKYKWVRTDFENIEIVESIRQIRLTLKSLSSSDRSAIVNQTGNEHQFEGKQWKFLGATINQTAASTWDVTYEWLHDPGNPAVPNQGPSYVLAPARYSFATYVIFPSETEGASPSINVAHFGPEDNNGYQLLPGSPI